MLYVLFICVVIFRLGLCSAVNISRPNIVIIVVDDLGWNDVSFHGSSQIPTPNIDALATSGIILHRYYVQSICTPSRAALLTGKYPIHTGMQTGVILTTHPYGVSLNETLMPQHLNRLGYVSHAIGKWHLGSHRAAYTPTRRGFHSHFGFWTGKKDYYDHINKDAAGRWGFDLRSDLNVSRDHMGHYTTDLLTTRAVSLVNGHDRSRPLFLYLAHQAVHSANSYQPLQAPAHMVDQMRHIRRGRRRRFAAMLKSVDVSVGRVIAALHGGNMLNNTLLVFTSDNGGPAAGFDQNAASNWPLRGVKNTLWEGGVRVAGFVWSPLLARYHTVYPGLVHITDILPTIYSAAGGDVEELGVIDGVDLWASLQQNTSNNTPRHHIVLNVNPRANYQAVISGRYKYIKGWKHAGRWSGWYGPSGRQASRQYDRLYETISRSTSGIILQQQGLLASRQQWSEITSSVTVRCSVKVPITPVFTLNSSNNTDRPAPATAQYPSEQANIASSSRRQCRRRACVFDLSRDPCEQHDLAALRPDLRDHLAALLSRLARAMVPARNKPSDPRADPALWNYVWTNWCDSCNTTCDGVP